MATSYTAIADGAVDAESPITTGLETKLRDNPLAIAEQTAGAPTVPFTRLMYVEEQKATGVDSATTLDVAGAASAVARRDLVEVVDTLGVAGAGGGSVGGANDTQITLPAGTYWIEADALLSITAATDIYAYAHRLEWYNTTTPVSAVHGPTFRVRSRSAADLDTTWQATLSGKFTAAADDVFELRHWGVDEPVEAITAAIGGSHSGGGLGALGEIYARIRLWQLIVP